MNTDHKKRYEFTVIRDMSERIKKVELDGWNRVNYALLRLLQDDMQRLEALDFFDRD